MGVDTPMSQGGTSLRVRIILTANELQLQRHELRMSCTRKERDWLALRMRLNCSPDMRALHGSHANKALVLILARVQYVYAGSRSSRSGHPAPAL